MYVHISVVYDGDDAHVCFDKLLAVFIRYTYWVAVNVVWAYVYIVRPIMALDKFKFDRIEDERKKKLTQESDIYWTIKFWKQIQ